MSLQARYHVPFTGAANKSVHKDVVDEGIPAPTTPSAVYVPVKGAEELESEVVLAELKLVFVQAVLLLPPSDNVRFNTFPFGA